MDVQALKAFITIPQSTLLRYTATDVADQSADFSQALSHNSLSYQVCSTGCHYCALLYKAIDALLYHV